MPKTGKVRKRRKYVIPPKVSLLYKFIECVKCRNECLEGLKGLVIDETKNTLIILTIDGKIRTIIKSECWYYVRIGDKVYLISPRQIR